jgi:hypothetical protein
VATASFLASRAVPSGGFVVALAGGVALARAAQRHGARHGFGASLAAMLQTVAIMGPARVGIPLTQAISAPILGRMHARGRGVVAQSLVTMLVRLGQNIPSGAFYVFVIVGIDAYAASYVRLLGWLPLLPAGRAGAIVATLLALAAWTIGASIVQVLVYRRGLLRWPADPPPPEPPAAEPPRVRPPSARFDPRVVVVAAIGAFGILLSGTWWPMLGAVGAWLAAAWLLARGDRSVVRPGVVLAAVLASGALVFGLVGGMGLDLTLRRTVRAALLVLVATWARYAAGEEGLRAIFRGLLRRGGRLPSLTETREVLDGLGSTPALAASGRRLVIRLRGVQAAPLAITDGVLDWVAGEAHRHAPPRPPL